MKTTMTARTLASLALAAMLSFGQIAPAVADEVAMDVEQPAATERQTNQQPADQQSAATPDLEAQSDPSDPSPTSGICGTCRWNIDGDNNLVIAPANGTSGTLISAEEAVKSATVGETDFGWPWLKHAATIKTVKVEPGVRANQSADNMFYGLGSATSIDLSGLDTTGVTSMAWMLADCISLQYLDISSLDNTKVSYDGRSMPPEMNGFTFLGTSSKLEFLKVGDKWDTTKAFPMGKSRGTWWSQGQRRWMNPEDPANSERADTYTSYRSFADVPAGHWARNVISRAAQMGIIAGYKDGSFGTNDPITRGQVAVILWRMSGKPAGSRSFPDVESDKYYAAAVSWAGTAGVVTGYANGRFGPNDYVTREQLGVMLRQYAVKVRSHSSAAAPSIAGAFVDMGSVSPWAYESMRWCLSYGIITGTTDNRINPKATATRAEAAKMLVQESDLLS